MAHQGRHLALENYRSGDRGGCQKLGSVDVVRVSDFDPEVVQGRQPNYLYSRCQSKLDSGSVDGLGEGSSFESSGRRRND